MLNYKESKVDLLKRTWGVITLVIGFRSLWMWNLGTESHLEALIYFPIKAKGLSTFWKPNKNQSWYVVNNTRIKDDKLMWVIKWDTIYRQRWNKNSWRIQDQNDDRSSECRIPTDWTFETQLKKLETPPWNTGRLRNLLSLLLLLLLMRMCEWAPSLECHLSEKEIKI
jgi:hypothetical protein